MVRIMVQVENSRKILNVSSAQVDDLKKTVFEEFGEILRPNERGLIFQKWDEDFQEYIDLDECSDLLKDKDKVQVLLSPRPTVNFIPSTPVTKKSHAGKVLKSPRSSTGSLTSSSCSTLSVDSESELSDGEPLGHSAKRANYSIPSEDLQIPEGLPRTFQLPRHFGQNIDKALRAGEVDNKIRNGIVRTVATCVRAVVDKTTPTICEFLAKKLIQQHPCLKEKDPREYLKAAGVKVSDKGRPFKNWMILKRQLQRKFDNMKSGHSEFNVEDMSSVSSNEESNGLGVEVDDAVTTERNIKKLKAELTKGKWNKKTVLELLKVTFVERRKAMLKNDARIRVRRALDEYRCLSHQVEFEAELLNCLQQVYGIDLSIEDMVSSWRRLIDPLLNMAKKMKILTTLEEDPDKKEIVALKCLPKLFKLKNIATADAEKYFIVFVEDESHERESAPSASPFLMVSPQVLLMENNKDEFLEVLDNDGLARAVICLVGIYYVFHLDYPGPAKGVFLFLQEHIFHHFLSKRPLRYAARLAELELPCV